MCKSFLIGLCPLDRAYVGGLLAAANQKLSFITLPAAMLPFIHHIDHERHVMLPPFKANARVSEVSGRRPSDKIDIHFRVSRKV